MPNIHTLRDLEPNTESIDVVTPVNQTINNSLTKCEKHNIDLINTLINTEEVPKKDITILRKIKKDFNNNNCIIVSYKKSQHNIGRRYAEKHGFQKLSGRTRRSAAFKHYWDIDIVNSQPTILLNLCIQNNWSCVHLKYYCENREIVLNDIMGHYNVDKDSAKNLILRLFFGGSESTWKNEVTNCDFDFLALPFLKKIEDEIKYIRLQIFADNTHIIPIAEKLCNSKIKSDTYTFPPDTQRTVLALKLQDEEDKILSCISTFFDTIGRPLVVWLYDGGYIMKKEGERFFPDDIIEKAIEYIKEHTNYDIALKIKEMVWEYSTKIDDPDIVPYGIIVNDNYAADIFVNLCMKDKIIFTNGKIYFYDITSGLWIDCHEDKTALEEVIKKFKTQLIIKQYNEDKRVIIHDYWGNVVKRDRMIRCIPSYCNVHKYFNHQRTITGFGKFLFNDGMYDMETNEFIDEFSSKYTFYDKIHRTRPIRNQNIIDNVFKILFQDAFPDEDRDLLQRLLIEIALGVHGGYTFRKQFIQGVGPSNASKGTISAAIESTFDEYIDNYDLDSFTKAKGTDTSRALEFMIELHKKRIIIGNEVDKVSTLSTDLLCKVVSGGDKLKPREIYTRKKGYIINYATVFALSNDIPEFDNPNDALINRKEGIIEFCVLFVNNPDPNNPLQKQRDVGLKDKLMTDKQYQDAVFYIIMDTYKSFLEKGGVNNIIIPKAFIINKNEHAGDIPTIYDVFKSNYEKSDNPEDKISINEVREVINAAFNKNPKTQYVINIELKRQQILPTDNPVRFSNGRFRAFLGYKSKSETSQFNDDDSECDHIDQCEDKLMNSLC